MKHPMHRVESFEIVSDYVLRVRFEDNAEAVIDFSPILVGRLYGPLRDLEVFEGVRIDPESHTLVWPNGADFDPAILHDWEQRGAAMRDPAQEWARHAADVPPRLP